MHGWEGERWIHRRHMWSVPKPATSSVAAPITPNSFSKDGRKICVGDCALFKPPQDSPPFIGIIRRLIFGKEENPSLSVNWLYRPADVKLGKGTLLEAAPNEVFYSFHKDEIPAASLLHPCKVSFLRKGVELPPGISSFVCRRVYDIENKCLWWLTDQDYINSFWTQERQEEVDQLLDKTRLEMYGAVQSGGRSPKRLNGQPGTPQLRTGSESVQNSSSSLPSQVKGKKRDRADQGSDPVKRERVSRADDTDSGQFRPEHILKSEIAKITEKGGLVDFEGVEKLVQLMQPDSAEKKIDLACRMMLVDVIAVTDRFDCLGRFVQLRGLPVLDEWLQDVHKGKIGDASSPKESDKSVDEFLLVLLRALDKLPVNLHALQTCNVGKSVNHLRTHKNSEIQKKARSLVDTWKKRVEAEMNVIDAKSGSSRGGSWPSKSVLSEASHIGNRRNGGSSEVSMKNSTVQSSACRTSVKLGSGEAVAKVLSVTPGSTKLTTSVSSSVGASVKDPNSATLGGAGSSDLPLSTIKEEKSSSSSQSQNNSQSCSSDHAKAGGSCREDARSSTAGSVSVSKISGSSSRHRKSSNGLQGLAVSGVQKETNLGKFSSLSRNLASEKVSPTRGTYERVPDGPLVDHGNSQRLIVRLPNTVRSPARSANGGSFEDPTATLSKASPSAQSEKLDHHDRKVKGKIDALRAKSTANSSMDLCQDKDGLIRSDEGDASSPGAPCNEWNKTADDVEKPMEASKGTGLSSGVKPKPGKSYDALFSSMNALVESCCVKISEASTSASGGDDIGMNLLASVAAGEMSRSDISASDSPEKNSPIPEESCSGIDVKSRLLVEDTARSEDPANDGANGDATLERGNSVDCLRVKNESPNDAMSNFSGDGKLAPFGCEERTGECNGQLNSSNIDLHQHAHGLLLKNDGRPAQVNDASVALSSEDATKARVPLSDEDKVINHAVEKIVEGNVAMASEVAASAKVEKEANAESPSCSSSEMCREDRSALRKGSGYGILTDQKLPSAEKIDEESIGGKSESTAIHSGSVNVLGVESKAEKAIDMSDMSSMNLVKNEECIQEKSERKEVLSHLPDGSTSQEEPASVPVQLKEECTNSHSGKLDGIEVGRIVECVSTVNASSGSAAGSDVVVKLDFDLNEGFPVDDGCQVEPAKPPVSGNLSTVHLPCPLPFPISSMTASFPASITVASAAKGPFFPPENPLRSKGELGWKGSAATSAFRPAEPRKVLEMPLSATGSPPVNNVTSKQGRPFLDIDLNEPDQRVLEDVACQNSDRFTCLESGPLDRRGGGLDLDLNRVDESPDIGQFSVSSSLKLEVPRLSGRSSLSGGFSNGELNASRDFDLNNGPGPDEGVSETAPRAKGNVPFLSPLPGVRINTTDQGNFSSWFTPSNSYSAMAIPSILPGRGDQSYPIVPAAASQRILGPSIGGSSFGPEFYRGPVLSSSPAVPFPPAAASFQYPGFPFETTFPLSSSSYSGGSAGYGDSSSGAPLCFSAIPSHLVGPSGLVSSHFPRPYVMNLPGGTSNVGPESRSWGGQGLDLNTGPGGTDVECRDERLSSALRQLPVPGSQAPADEQIKMYQMAGGVLKRKEPDGGWDGDRISYKHPSWQ